MVEAAKCIAALLSRRYTVTVGVIATREYEATGPVFVTSYFSHTIWELTLKQVRG